MADLNLRANRFNIELEFTSKILKHHFRVYEVPITFNLRVYAAGNKSALRMLLKLFGRC